MIRSAAKINIVPFVLLAILLSFAPQTLAQPQSRMTFCLNLAQAVQTAVFIEKKKYITNEDDLRKELTSGCAGLRYEVSLKAGGGFRVVSETNGEAWAIDEKRELIQLTENKGGTAASPAQARSTASASPAARGKVQGAPTVAPTNPAAPTPFLGKPDPTAAATPAVAAVANVNAPSAQEQVVAPDAVANNRMQQCFAKSAFHSEACTNLFNELESKCGQNDVPLARLCLELESTIASVDMGECGNNDAEWGKCELRRRQLEKKCSNRLRQASAECRGLAKYLASVVPDLAANAKSSTTSSTTLQPDLAGALSRPPPGGKAKSLDPSLRTVLRLRPVTFENKAGRPVEMGFVAEEVELVNSSLISYSADHLRW